MKSTSCERQEHHTLDNGPARTCLIFAPVVCGLIGHKFKHHDALEDAKAAGALILAAGRKTGLPPAAWLVERAL